MPQVPNRDEIAEIADPAERLVQAGARLLADDGFRILANGLSPDLVTGLAGRTRRVFYDHFETKEEFARAVLATYLDAPEESDLTSEFLVAFEELIFEARGDIIDAVSAISEALFATTDDAGEDLLHSIAWGVGASDPTVRSSVDRYLTLVDDLYEHLVDRALVEWGQKLRAPWTSRDLSRVIRALSDGFQARNRVQPRSVGPDFFATCILAVIAPLMQRADEADRPFGEELRGLSRQNAAQWRERNDPALIANTRQRVLDSVVPALRQGGPAGVSMDSIARWADVSLGSLTQAFASSDEVVCTAIVDALPSFDREIDFDLGTDTMSTRKVLHRHLLRLAQWTTDQPELAHAALTLPMLRPAAHPDEPPARLLTTMARPATRILEVADAERELARPAADVHQLALMITQSVLSRSVRPQGNDHTLVAFLADVALGPEES